MAEIFRASSFGDGERLSGRRHAVDQADAVRLRGGHALVGRQDELHRPGNADETREPLGAAVAREDSEARLGQAHPRVLGRDAEAAGHRELEASAVGVAVDGGDRRHRKALEALQDRLSTARVLAALDGRQLRELADVGARDERLLARARDDETPQVAVIGGVRERAIEGRKDVGVQRVQLLGAVHRHRADAGLGRDAHQFAHAFPPYS